MQYVLISQDLISLFQQVDCCPIQKPYSLRESALVEDQNDIHVLGLWTFVLEEFGYNVPDYISSLEKIRLLNSDLL